MHTTDRQIKTNTRRQQTDTEKKDKHIETKDRQNKRQTNGDYTQKMQTHGDNRYIEFDKNTDKRQTYKDKHMEATDKQGLLTFLSVFCLSPDVCLLLSVCCLCAFILFCPSFFLQLSVHQSVCLFICLYVVSARLSLFLSPSVRLSFYVFPNVC